MIAACVVPTVKHGGGVMVLTLSVIYLEFKAHLTSMVTTAFWSDSPSHLVYAEWEYHLLINKTMIQHTARLCKGYLTKKQSDGVLHQTTSFHPSQFG
jgi:hypothetical protein